MTIRLYHGGARGHSAAVLFTIAELGLDIPGEQIDLARFGQWEADFLALNPGGQVPVLDVDGAVLRESFFLMQFCDEALGQGALGGATPKARYAVAKWGKYVETHIAPNLAVVRWAARGLEPDAHALARLESLTPERRDLWLQALAGFSAGEVAAAYTALAKAQDRIAADLAGRAWLADAQCTLADLAVFPHVSEFAGLGIRPVAEVSKWLARMAARPAIAAAGGLAPPVATMGPERGRWG